MKKTCLYQEHLALKAKMVEFAGYEMPLYYSSIAAEHEQVRQRVGMFDVSHMGEFMVEGDHATAFVEKIFSNRVGTLMDGQIAYGFLCREDGGVWDDLLVYKHHQKKYLLVVNAANIAQDFEWLNQHLMPAMTLTNHSDELSEIALQGPQAATVLKTHFAFDPTSLPFFSFKETQLLGGTVLISRTGYTGEDGFELYAKHDVIVMLWKAFLTAGVQPIGLGARDTLRFEAALPLYGHELSPTITPLEAGLSFAVDLTKDFIGSKALKAQKEAKLKRRLVGLRLLSKGIMREGYNVFHDNEQVGVITTGYKLPTQNDALALALIDVPYHKLGTQLTVEIRQKRVPAEVRDKKFRRKNTKEKMED